MKPIIKKGAGCLPYIQKEERGIIHKQLTQGRLWIKVWMGSTCPQLAARQERVNMELLPLMLMVQVMWIEVQEPLICLTHLPGQVFALPSPAKCTYTKDIQEEPVPARYQLFKHNLIKYSTSGWLCRAEEQTVRLKTYLFGIEHLKEFGRRDIPVDPSECKRMARDKISLAGRLKKTATGMWSTLRKLIYEVPGPFLGCCKWVKYQAINYHLIPGTVYKRHDQETFSSTIADMSHCPSYLDGECKVGNQGASMVWRPVMNTTCEYIP